MIEAVQKVIVQGSSCMITLPRRLLMRWGIGPGEFVHLSLDENTNIVSVRRWGNENISRSPGILPTPPVEPTR